MDWKLLLLDEAGGGGSGRERLQRVAASLDEADVKQVLQLITSHLSTKSEEVTQIRTLSRFQRRQSEHERYGSDLLQERIAVDLSRNHPIWKRHGLYSVTTWQQWCNRIYDSIGDHAFDRHLTRLYPEGPRPFYARLAVVKLIVEGIKPNSEYYPTFDDEKVLLQSLERQSAAAVANTLAEFASLER